MSWQIIRKRIGRAGSLKQRTGRQREWDRLYGEDQWAVGYRVDGQFLLQEDAWESIYYRSYEVYPQSSLSLASSWKKDIIWYMIFRGFVAARTSRTTVVTGGLSTGSKDQHFRIKSQRGSLSGNDG